MRTLLVATHGGHVSEMLGLHERIVDLGEELWISNDHPQTQVALAGKDVELVPFIDSRDLLGVIKALPHAFRRIRAGNFDRVVSTGSAIALAYLPVAAALRVPAHYIESSTRVDAPSITGRILAKVPGVTTWWQHEPTPAGWRSLTGLYAPFSSEPADQGEVTSVAVTVGTTEYCFRRLVERLVAIIPPGVDVFWQVGATDTSGLDIDAHTVVDNAELRRHIAKADVVVSHAGAGSLLQCLEAGKLPVYVPRLSAHDEQVDDHQIELAEWANNNGLARTVDASTVTWQDLNAAARRRVVAATPQPIDLEGR